jgi:hypothetical protein
MALLRGRRLMFCDERKEASQGCQPAVPRRNARMPITFDVLQKSENPVFRQVFQLQFRYLLAPLATQERICGEVLLRKDRSTSTLGAS